VRREVSGRVLVPGRARGHSEPRVVGGGNGTVRRAEPARPTGNLKRRSAAVMERPLPYGFVIFNRINSVDVSPTG
jgi:hypothetical protein